MTDGSGAAQNFGSVTLHHLDFALLGARLRPFQNRLHLFARKRGIAIVRRDTSGFEPRFSPHILAQRRKLTKMRRPFDRAALEPEFLRRRIIVYRGVGVVDLGIKHLMWPAPWPDERIGGLRDDRFKRLRSHRTPRKCQPAPGAGIITLPAAIQYHPATPGIFCGPHFALRLFR